MSLSRDGKRAVELEPDDKGAKQGMTLKTGEDQLCRPCRSSDLTSVEMESVGGFLVPEAHVFMSLRAITM